MYRVLLIGSHLMQTRTVEADPLRLDEIGRLSFIQDLIAVKTHGREKEPLDAASFDYYEREYWRLSAMLEDAYRAWPCRKRRPRVPPCIIC